MILQTLETNQPTAMHLGDKVKTLVQKEDYVPHQFPLKKNNYYDN